MANQKLTSPSDADPILLISISVPRACSPPSLSAQRTDKLTLICNKASVELLSNREYKVLCLIIAGYENDQIAEMLGITDHTVNEHRRNLARHFCAKKMPLAIVFALRMGLY